MEDDSTKITEYNNKLINIIKGMIYGQCLGDAYGNIMQNGVKGELINKTFPNINATNDWSDKTDQTILLLDMLINSASNNFYDISIDADDFRDFCKNLSHWSELGFEEVGDTGMVFSDDYTKQVISSPNFVNTPMENSYNIWIANQKLSENEVLRNSNQTKANGMKSATGTAVARSSILSLLYIVKYLENGELIPMFYKDIDALCRVTHYDLRCVVSCWVIAHILQIIIAHKLLNIDVKNVKLHCYQIIDLIIKNKPASEFPANYDYNIFMTELLNYFNCHIVDLNLSENVNYTYKTMACGLWVADIIETFVKKNGAGKLNFQIVMNMIVREGGNANGNAAVAGAVLGCYIGYNDLPQEWLAVLPNKYWLDEKVDLLLQMLTVKSTDNVG